MISELLALMLSFASMPVNGAPPAPPVVTVAPEQQLETSALPARHAALQRYAHTIVVSAVGGDDWGLNGTRLLDAIDKIQDASPDRLYLIKVLPGHYFFVGDRRLVMKPYVDIEGSGRNVTFLESLGASGPLATVTTAADAEIRGVRIVSNGSGERCSIAVSHEHLRARISDALLYATGGTWKTVALESPCSLCGMPNEPTVHDVTIWADSSGEHTYGISAWGDGWYEDVRVRVSGRTSTAALNVLSGEVRLVDSELFARGYTGVPAMALGHDSSLTIRNVAADAGTNGTALSLDDNPRAVEILNSVLKGATAISGGSPYVTVSVGASKIDGEIDFSSGTVFRCARSFDGEYRTLSATCR